MATTTKLQPGQKVMIYEDPYTGERAEGEAKLIERVGGESEYDARAYEGTGAERWAVAFRHVDGEWDHDTYERLIVLGVGDN